MVAQPPPGVAGGHAGAGVFGTSGGTALLAVVSSVAEVAAAVDAGAELVDLGNAGPDAISEVKARYPSVLVCAASPPADVVRDAAVARATGTAAICAGLDAARASSLPAGRLLVDVPPGLVWQAGQAGWAGLVDADRAALAARREAARPVTAGEDPAVTGPAGEERAEEDSAGIVAMAAISSWLGAAVIRTRHPAQVRRALDMTASIRGGRPPDRAVRGLALSRGRAGPARRGRMLPAASQLGSGARTAAAAPSGLCASLMI